MQKRENSGGFGSANDRQMLLLRAGRRLNETLEITAILRELVVLAVELTCANGGAAGRYVDETMHFTEYYRNSRFEDVQYSFPRDVGVPGWIISHKQAYISHDAASDPNVLPEVRQAVGFSTLIDVPILGRDGSLLGCFEMHDLPEEGLCEKNVEAMTYLADIAAVAMQNAMLMDDHARTIQALRLSEEHFRDFFENAVIGFFICNLDGLVIDANPAFCMMLGYPATRIINHKTTGHLLSRGDASRFDLDVQLLIQKGTLHDLEYAMKTADGRNVEVLLNGYIGFDMQGRPQSLRFSAMEITSRKLAELAVEQSESRFRDFFDNAPTGFHIFGPDFVISDINKAELQMIGYTWEEVVGRKTWADLLVPEQRDLFKKHRHLLLTRGEITGLEYTLMHKDGHLIDVMLNASARFDEDGNFLNTRGSVIDITGQKKTHLELEASERRQRQLVDTMGEGVGILDTQFRYVYVSRQLAEMLGYEPQEMLGRYVMEFHDEENQKIIASREHEVDKPYDLAWTTKDGGRLHTLVAPRWLYDDDGNFSGSFALVMDITALKQTQLQVEQERDRAQLYLNVVNVVMIALDVSGTITLVNRKGCELLGRDASQIEGKNWFENFLPPDDRAATADYFHKIISGEAGDVDHHTNAVLVASGQTRIIEWHNSVLRDRNNNITGVLSSGEDITESKMAEQRLEQERNLLKTLIDTWPDRIYIKDRHSRFVIVNQTMARDHGFDRPEDMIGLTPFDYLPPQRAEALSDEDEQMLKTGEPVMNRETRSFVNPDRVYLISKVPLRDAEGEIWGIASINRDITDIKLAEQSLLLRDRAIAAATNAIIITDHSKPDDPVIYVNSAFTAITGYSSEEVIGRNCRFLQGNDKAQRGLVELRRAVSREKSCRCVLRNYRKDGTMFWNDLTISPVFDEKNTLTNYIGVINDITERRQAEEQAKSLARFPSENPNPVLRISHQGVVLYANNAAQPLLREWRTDISQIVPQRIKEIISATMKKGAMERLDFEYIGRTFAFVLVPFVAGAYINLYGSDITDRVDAQHVRDRLNRELIAKNRELEAIIYAASHDLRSPLVNIQGFTSEIEISITGLRQTLAEQGVQSQMLQKIDTIITNDISESVRYVRASARKMDELIAGLLRVSRVGRLPMQVATVDMNKLIEGVVATMQFQVQEAAVALEVEPLPRCLGDQSLLGQVFANLLDNALKYLDNSRAGMIRITGETHGDMVVYCVEDNGRGILAEHLAGIFDIFHRLDPALGSGEGLGLTIVRRIVDRHDGKVWVESEAGKGSKFFVALPAANEV